MRLKIVQINATYGIGSTGLIMKDIDELISLQPDMQSIVAYQRTNAPVSNGICIGNIIDWKFHAVCCRLAGRQGYYSILATKNFLRKLEKIKPDIVHLHNLHSNYINIQLLLQYLAKNDIRTIITMHDCWWFTGKCFHYVDVNCKKFKTGCGNCPKKDTPPKSLFGDFSKQVYSSKKELLLSIPRLTIVGCSDWICREATESFLNGCDIRRIYNGVNTDTFKPKNYRPENKIRVLGMANKWLNSRNIGIVEKILGQTNASIKILGCSEAQRELLNGHSDRIEALGFISDRTQLSDIYNSVDVFVNLTHADTLPTVNMESICCGTPVITYNSTGSPELIDDKTGIIVAEDDQDKIVELLKIGTFPERQTCASEGFEKFDKETCYSHYIELYRSVI